jgi:hypothetical protein
LELGEKKFSEREGYGVELESFRDGQDVTHLEAPDEDVKLSRSVCLEEEEPTGPVERVERVALYVAKSEEKLRNLAAPALQRCEIDVIYLAPQGGVHRLADVKSDGNAAKDAQRNPPLFGCAQNTQGFIDDV